MNGGIRILKGRGAGNFMGRGPYSLKGLFISNLCLLAALAIEDCPLNVPTAKSTPMNFYDRCPKPLPSKKPVQKNQTLTKFVCFEGYDEETF